MDMKKNKTDKIIMKFGGTSVGSPKAVKQLITIVSSSKDPVLGVVVSAFSHVTNQLIEATELASNGNKQYRQVFLEIADRHKTAIVALVSNKEIQKETEENIEKTLTELKHILQGVFLIKEITPKIMDTIMSYGERLSAYIISQSFKDNGFDAEFIDARKLVKTDAAFGMARVQLNQTYTNIHENFKKSKTSLKIITGYIGSTEKNETTTLGRGGSDYTASLFGVAIKASRIEIWTDVNGVLTADPRKVSSAFTIPQLTYQEAMEMSHFGAKVIYPQTMVPAYIHRIPIVIRNTFQPKFEGTVISSKTSNKYIIKGISSIEKVSLLLLQGSGLRGTPGIAARLFGALAVNQINIILITQASSEYTICLAIDPMDTEKAKSAILDEFKQEIEEALIDRPIIEEMLSIVAVVGEQMRNSLGVAGKLFTTLSDVGVNVAAIAQGSSERNISFVISKKDETKALKAIHYAFFNV
jgi:bifunctional aspartokinase / homoserine dehydrogenase 1